MFFIKMYYNISKLNKSIPYLKGENKRMNTIETKVNINEVIGHYVEAEITLKGYLGKVKEILTGRIIYSEYNASLFFKPKGSRNKGYIIENESDIHFVNIIRKDNKSHIYYKELYKNKYHFEEEYAKRIEKEKEQRQEQQRIRQEKFELERKKKQEREQQQINEAKQLGGYEELEKEVIDFYESFEGEFYNEKFIKNTYIPILNKLIHKSINTVNEYPKHYFCKKRNPKFVKLIETKLNVKLGNTQKGM